MGKRIIVTGANGLLARYIIKELVVNNFVVTAVSNNKNSARSLYSGLNNLDIINYDEMSQGCLKEFNGCSIIHTAFTRKNDGEQVAKSLDNTLKVLELAKTMPAERFYNISSRSVYQEPEEGCLNDEHSLINPLANNAIGIGKYAAELLVQACLGCTKIKYTNLRISSVNELKLDNTMARPLNAFVDAMINGRDIKVVGGMQVMSFIDPRDVAAAILALLYVDDLKTVYNIGTGWLCTDNLLNMAQLVVERGVNKGFNPVNIVIEEKQVNQRAGLDISRLQSDTNWNPAYDLNKMIDSLYELKTK